MNDLVFRGADNQALTNSLLVAEKFGKRHADVLDAIRELFVSAEKSVKTNNQQLSEMFALVEYDVALNNGTGGIKKAPMYVMNRDGFTLLVMGFTGRKAFQFKLAYIAAFNAMEKVIKEEYTRILSDMDQRIKGLEEKFSSSNEFAFLMRLTSGISLRENIQYLIDDCVRRMGVTRKNVWFEICRQLYNRYRIPISLYKKKSSEEKIMDLMDRYGLLFRIYAIVLDMHDIVTRYRDMEGIKSVL